MIIINSKERMYDGYLSVDKCNVSANGKTLNLEIIERGDSSAILLVDPKTLNCLIVKQFRPAIMDEMIGPVAGMIDDGETPLAAAIRELSEEASLTINESSTVDLGAHHLSPGVLTEKTHCFLAFMDLGSIKAPYSTSNESESEYITVDIVSLGELKSLKNKTASLTICILEAEARINI